MAEEPRFVLELRQQGSSEILWSKRDISQEMVFKIMTLLAPVIQAQQALGNARNSALDLLDQLRATLGGGSR